MLLLIIGDRLPQALDRQNGTMGLYLREAAERLRRLLPRYRLGLLDGLPFG